MKTIFGLISSQLLEADARDGASAPGRIASTTASAFAASARKISFASSVRRSSVRLFFPRFTCRCISETPSTIGHVISRT